MAGTAAGAAKAKKTNKERYGKGFYAEIGRKGGKAPTDKLKGFAADRKRAREAGKIGGAISRRGKPNVKTQS